MVLTWAQILMILIIRVSNRRLVQRTEPIGKLPVQKDDAPEGWNTDWLVMPEDTPVHFLCYKGTGWHSPMSHEASRNQSLWEVGSCVWMAQDPRNLSWWSLSDATSGVAALSLYSCCGPQDLTLSSLSQHLLCHRAAPIHCDCLLISPADCLGDGNNLSCVRYLLRFSCSDYNIYLSWLLLFWIVGVNATTIPALHSF